FNAMTQANTDDTLQRVQTEEAPRLAAHLDAIHLNDTLFRRVRSVYDRRGDLGLDSVQGFLVERYYRDFVRAGALLAEPDKARLLERHAGRRQAAGAAPRGPRPAARLPEPRRVRPRRSDGQDAGRGDQAVDRSGAGGDGAGPPRGGEAASDDQHAARRLQAGPVGLAVLRRAGAQGGVRAGRDAAQALLRALPRARGRRLLRREPAVRVD